MIRSLKQFAQALGGDVCGREVLAPGPGHSPRDRSLAIRLTENSFVVHSFAGDDPLACKDYVRRRLGLPDWQPGDEQDRRIHPSRIRNWDRAAIDAETEDRTRTADDLNRIARAVAIWNQAADPRGTPAEAYLRARCLDLTGDIAGAVLRFHPRCPWRNENTGCTDRVPALIVAFRSIDDDAITGIHRIRVDEPERWPKVDRRMLGIMQRSAAKLAAVSATLHIGEGLETCLAAQRLGYTPAWALGSAGMIGKFPLLDGVICLRLLGETGSASADAIKLAAQRWQRAGRRVQVVMPSAGSDDLNAELMAVTP